MTSARRIAPKQSWLKRITLALSGKRRAAATAGGKSRAIAAAGRTRALAVRSAHSNAQTGRGHASSRGATSQFGRSASQLARSGQSLSNSHGRGMANRQNAGVLGTGSSALSSMSRGARGNGIDRNGKRSRCRRRNGINRERSRSWLSGKRRCSGRARRGRRWSWPRWRIPRTWRRPPLTARASRSRLVKSAEWILLLPHVAVDGFVRRNICACHVLVRRGRPAKK